MSRASLVRRSLAVVGAGLALSGCATATVDRAYERALQFGNEPRRGIILFLHGCDGLGGPRLFAWQTAWVQHLTRQGFVVVAPDSFADPRPPQSCRAPFPNKEEIYQLRARQAAVAIERIRLRYPTSRLIVWGHSEGAGVANLLTSPVDGIITTGYQCGYRSTGRMWIGPMVPLLAIMGTADPYIVEAVQLAKVTSAEDLCRAVFTSAKWRATIVPGMPHAASLDRPEVRAALDRFLDELAP